MLTLMSACSRGLYLLLLQSSEKYGKYRICRGDSQTFKLNIFWCLHFWSSKTRYLKMSHLALQSSDGHVS